jgi:catechol 2,3-dioxygenase-like lactoylglutathione lyase family enzyme
MRLDSVQIGVADRGAARDAYRILLGVEPVTSHGGAHRFQLERGAVELESGDPGLHSIRFRLEAGDAALPEDAETWHGLCVRTAGAAGPPAAPAPSADAVVAIDHVVVRTPDAERAIRLWRDRFGLRLALDRVFGERGLRLLFFRSGGITLEFASAHPADPTAASAPDQLYGMSYRVADLHARRARLLDAGVEVSVIRPGMRPGTSVATVRSGTAGVPTILLQVDAQPEAAVP